MSGHIYKTLEITGTSTDGIDDAVKRAIAGAGKTVHNLRWFEVADIRGEIEDGAIMHWQVAVKLSFRVEQ